MFDKARDRLIRAAQFAERHHTLVACTVTGVITWKVTRNVTFNTAMEEAGAYVYEVGRENGHMLLQNRVMLDFINQEGLGERLEDHILSMRQ